MSFHDELRTATAAERNELLGQPLIQAALNGQVTLGLYQDFLTQAYHHVKHTVPLMMACGARLDGDREWLRAKLVSYVMEEYGHHEWVLDDLRASGGDAEVARLSEPSIETEVMVAYAYDLIARGNPASFFGMVHVLEGTSTALATQAAQSIAETLRLPRSAFRYLLSHGSLDIEHVDFFRTLVEALNREDQLAVIAAARRFYRLYGAIFTQLHHQHLQREIGRAGVAS